MKEFHNETYISLPERAAIVEQARTNRSRLKTPPKFKYPGFKGEPSILPDGPNRKKK